MERNFVCYYCGKPRHQLRFYKKLKKDKRIKRMKVEDNDKLDVGSDDEVNLALVMTLSVLTEENEISV